MTFHVIIIVQSKCHNQIQFEIDNHIDVQSLIESPLNSIQLTVYYQLMVESDVLLKQKMLFTM